MFSISSYVSLPSGHVIDFAECLAIVYTQKRSTSTGTMFAMLTATISYIHCPLTNVDIGEILLPLLNGRRTGGHIVNGRKSAPDSEVTKVLKARHVAASSLETMS